MSRATYHWPHYHPVVPPELLFSFIARKQPEADGDKCQHRHRRNSCYGPWLQVISTARHSVNVVQVDTQHQILKGKKRVDEESKTDQLKYGHGKNMYLHLVRSSRSMPNFETNWGFPRSSLLRDWAIFESALTRKGLSKLKTHPCKFKLSPCRLILAYGTIQRTDCLELGLLTVPSKSNSTHGPIRNGGFDQGTEKQNAAPLGTGGSSEPSLSSKIKLAHSGEDIPHNPLLACSKSRGTLSDHPGHVPKSNFPIAPMRPLKKSFHYSTVLELHRCGAGSLKHDAGLLQDVRSILTAYNSVGKLVLGIVHSHLVCSTIFTTCKRRNAEKWNPVAIDTIL